MGFSPSAVITSAYAASASHLRTGWRAPSLEPILALTQSGPWRLDKPLLEQPNESIIAMCMALEAMENQPALVELLAWL